MVNAAARQLLCSGAVLATAGAMALGPLPLPPSPSEPTLLRPALPVVSVDDIDLTGIGQDIYYAITPTVQYVVGGVSYLINFIPLIGGPIAAQININYFQGVQPVVEATVNYLAAVVQDPLNFIASTQAYGETLYDIGYNWVSAELMFLGLEPLPPLPQSAAAREVRGPRPAAAVEAVGGGPVRGGAAVAAAIDGEEVAVPAVPASVVPGAQTGDHLPATVRPATPRERIRVARSGPRTAPARDAAAAAAPGSQNAASNATPAERTDPAGQRSSARATRGS